MAIIFDRSSSMPNVGGVAGRDASANIDTRVNSLLVDALDLADSAVGLKLDKLQKQNDDRRAVNDARLIISKFQAEFASDAKPSTRMDEAGKDYWFSKNEKDVGIDRLIEKLHGHFDQLNLPYAGDDYRIVGKWGNLGDVTKADLEQTDLMLKSLGESLGTDAAKDQVLLNADMGKKQNITALMSKMIEQQIESKKAAIRG